MVKRRKKNTMKNHVRKGFYKIQANASIALVGTFYTP